MNEVNQIWQNTFFFVPNWKWGALLGIIAFGIVIIPFLKASIARLKVNQRLQKIHPLLEFFLDLEIQGPLAWVLITFVWHSSIDALNLGPKFERNLMIINQLILSFYLIRLAYLAVEATGKWIDELVKKTENTLDDQLAPLATKTLKVFVIVFGTLIVLQNFGFNVMSLLAGLGLGGLALALAAQDTAANVFGSITIILDRPFQVGDWVKVGDTEGTVEEIGFRSTRIRTFYQSVVSIPNSVMAKEKIDNMGVRPYRRIRHVLGVTYDTPNIKIQQFMEQIRYLLIQQPLVLKEDIRVYFNQMGDFSLQILVQFFLNTNDGHEEFQTQEEILLAIKEIATKTGVEFAFPTQTIDLRQPAAPMR